MTRIRSLDDLDDASLAEWYAAEATPWLRLNFVATVDGAVQGDDGLSKSINDEADARVFMMLRDLADVIVVGAGTIRTEAYQPNPKPLVVVTRSGQVPASLREGDLSQVYVATGAAAPHLAEARELLGSERTLVLGERGPDLAALRATLVERGFADLLCEGGPHLARDLLAGDLVDELCLTTVPRLLAGERMGLLAGAPIDRSLELSRLLVAGDTLLARWLVQRP